MVGIKEVSWAYMEKKTWALNGNTGADYVSHEG
jgi:hypothetical protein